MSDGGGSSSSSSSSLSPTHLCAETASKNDTLKKWTLAEDIRVDITSCCIISMEQQDFAKGSFE